MYNIRTFESLRNPCFCFYMGAMLCQMAGFHMQMMTRQLLVYRLTGSATVLGTLTLAMSLPMLATSLFGGVIADRFQKKYILQIGFFIASGLAFCVGLALSLDFLSQEHKESWWILVVTAFLQGTFMGLMLPARQSIVPEIVGEERLMNALALNNLGMSLLQIISPALAGLLIDMIGFEAVFYTVAGANLLAICFISFIPPLGKTSHRHGKTFAEIKDGLRYLWNNRTIFTVLIFSLLFILLTMPHMSLMPIFTDDILKVGATGMGTLFAVEGIGAGFTALVLASLPNKKRGLLFLICGLILGVALTGFSFSEHWYLSLTLIVFVGLAQAGNMTLGNTITQYYVESRYRGRVMSVWLMNFGLMGFGTFFASILADYTGVQWAVGGLALVLLILAFLALLFLPQLRRLD